MFELRKTCSKAIQHFLRSSLPREERAPQISHMYPPLCVNDVDFLFRPRVKNMVYILGVLTFSDKGFLYGKWYQSANRPACRTGCMLLIGSILSNHNVMSQGIHEPSRNFPSWVQKLPVVSFIPTAIYFGMFLSYPNEAHALLSSHSLSPSNPCYNSTRGCCVL